MPFKVRATCVKMSGDMEKFPCQFGHKIGDEVIFDGETVTGKMCPDLLLLVYPHAFRMHYDGPRYRDHRNNALWVYQGAKQVDPAMKQYDGLGYKPVAPYKLPPNHVAASLLMYTVPGVGPLAKKKVDLPVTIKCSDIATQVVFKLEAFALCDSGRALPYFRRQMSIVDKIKAKPGIAVQKILDEFTTWEREQIYPPLGGAMLEMMLEELALTGYVQVRDGKAYPAKDAPPR